MAEVIVVIGSGSIAQAIARRVSSGKKILLADINRENAQSVSAQLKKAGFDASAIHTDVRSRESIQQLVAASVAAGEIKGVILTAGLSPSQAKAQDLLHVDLYGSAVVFEEFGKVIATGGSCVVLGSQSSHRLDCDALSQQTADQLATLSPEELTELPWIKAIDDSLYAYQIAKRGNALRVMAEAAKWGKRGARINCISAGIIFTPLAYDELNSAERGEYYRNMLEKSPAGRGGTPDEIAALAEFMFGPNGSYISGSDILIDGGVTASVRYGDLKTG
ncbi:MULTISPECIES: SDR family oxidoreductase [unclassified Tatumella]|uniref:SDR family oxidoreductase n=1 Tax=unclassified Tatumella TaxID=2649542 RepID=UPI001BB0D38C|nr:MULTISPECIES: SDR family oxidoreductase [unclassified Tatumella]MBS0875827.1 SDR family oxidoreductase [Tatumella sp. JGM82]MBS0890232.1 SDR family oxidoreductase [Tatumella sp. JGM94]MBS0894266.1 SDR family oxidoreductase [Tatumella sp. JGM130]MBS0900358.1 SDR family oxidoreductase [Tatumella sp. JGM100]